MAYQKNLQTVYHQQDTDFYCGAACAQMVLDAIGAGLLDQGNLYTDNHNHSRDESQLTDAWGNPVNWATAPDGLRWTLNDREPGGYYFVEFALGSEDAISRKIAWTIEHYSVAPCALVLGSAHWVVVRGMELSQAPTGSGDVSYTITNFRINDPWPPVPSSTYWNNPTPPPPPPHAAGDGCGTGGNRGTADEVITYAQWENTYMTGANYHPQGHWQGLFVAVCDPEPPAVIRGPSVPRVRRFKGERLIRSEEVTRLAMEMVEKGKLPKDGAWRRSLSRVKAADPVLVQRLDRVNEYYYFVPLVSSRKAATAAVAFDARFGDFQQAISFPEPAPMIANPPTNDAVLRQVLGQTYEIEKYKPVKAIEGVTNVIAHWFWRPCLESLSPFWPFKMVLIGGNKVYVRIDGQVFTTLHEGVYGI